MKLRKWSFLAYPLLNHGKYLVEITEMKIEADYEVETF